MTEQQIEDLFAPVRMSNAPTRRTAADLLPDGDGGASAA